MADSFITKCPNCSTFFRVRTAQLAMANGSVRCGACLQVFNAQTNLSSRSIAVNTSNTVKNANRTASFNTEPPSSAESKTQSNATDLPATETATSERNDSAVLTDSVENTDDRPETKANDSYLANSNTLNEQAIEETNSKATTDDSAESGSQPPQQRPEPSIHASESLTPSELDISEDPPLDFELFTDSLPSQEIVEAARESKKQRRLRIKKQIKKTNATQVVKQASEQIEHDFPFEARMHRLRPLGWLVIAMLLCLAFSQWAWYNREVYAKMDQWRGFYSAVCDRIGCQLPEQTDLLSIRSSISIREAKDPALSDILIVDVVLTNRAAFKQKFPALLLQYTDLNGKLIADQLFQPDSYLRGEMTGVELMPINTRIYAVIAIQRPDPSAINYQLLLMPAN